MNPKVKRSFLAFGIFLLACFLVNPVFPQADGKINKVVIDAGHGGKDPGALGKQSREKDIALSIALKTGAYIEKYLPDVEVIYTRKTDKFIKLSRRAEMANELEADLFISIHCNANNSHKIYGTETYVMGLHKTQANLDVAKKENAALLYEEDFDAEMEGFDPNSPESYIFLSLFQNEFLEHSILMASKVQDQFRERVGRKDRSVMQAGFWVLYKTAMPSVLIETGYLSNPTEEKFLRSEEGQVFIASAIYRAFKEYKTEMEKYNKPEELAVYVKQESEEDSNGNEEEAKKKEDPDVYFAVQIKTSKRKKKPDSKEFKGLKDVSFYEQDGLFKYICGNEKSFAEANQLRKEISKKGYKDAFVVAFQDGKRIPTGKARELTEN